MKESSGILSENSFNSALVDTFTSALNIPFIITDFSGNIIKAGNSFFPLFDIGKSIIMGESINEFIDESSRIKISSIFDDPHLKTGKTIQSSISGLKRDGSPVPLIVSITSLEKMPEYCLLTFENRSEQIKEQGKIEKLEHQAAIGTFTSTVAHEFNNVLAGIRGYAQLMKNDPSDTHLAEKASNIIEQETARGAEICRNLSLYSGAHRMTLEAVNISDVIERCAELQRNQITDSTVIKTICSEIPPVLLDRHRIQQVLVNMITNARHAVMPKGGGNITITSSIESSMIVIKIEDTGIGIPAYNLSKIFDPFFSNKTPPPGSSLIDNSPRGTGLGLPVCQVIIRQHGGSIDVASKQGEGTAFTIKIPSKYASIPKPYRTNNPEIRALVVDDDMPVREVIFRALSLVKVETSLAHNVTEMNRLLETEHYDIIFLDYVLPEMNADRLLPKIKEKLPDARIVIISGWSGSPAKKSTIEKSVDAWIDKPFNVEAIMSQLKPLQNHAK